MSAVLALVPPAEVAEARPSANSAQYELAFALCDPGYTQTPGLFRSVARGTSRQERLHVKYTRGETTYVLKGDELLGAVDARVSAVLVGYAALAGSLISVGSDYTANTANGNLRDTRVVTNLSISAVAREAGYKTSGGGSRLAVFDSVMRLGATTVQEFVGGRARSTPMSLLWMTFTEAPKVDDRRMDIVLNPWLVSAILGGPFSRISLREMRTSPSDSATLLIWRLSGILRPGTSREIREETLLGYVHGVDATGAYVPATGGEAERKRRQRLKLALAETSWKISAQTKGLYTICRPALRD